MKSLLSIISFILFASNIFSQSIGGILSSNTTVCQGNNSGILSVSSFSGSIIRWENSSSSVGPWVQIAHTSTSYGFLNLTQTTYYRVIVQLAGNPSSASNFVVVNCDSPSIAGIVTSPTLQCLNSSVTCSLVGSTGNILSWDYSQNNWISFNSYSVNASPTFTLSSLTTTTQIRALVKNGVCPSAFSNSITILPASNSIGGIIGGPSSVCSGSNSANLILSNYTGQIIQWENSFSMGGTNFIISGTSGLNSIPLSNISQNSWLRVKVQNANCPSVYSQTFALTVDPPTATGSLTGISNVCGITNSGTVTLVNNVGTVNQWLQSTDLGITWTNIANATASHTFQNISSTNLFKVAVQSGVCPTLTTAIFTVNVNALPSPTFNIYNSCVEAPLLCNNYTSGSNTFYWNFGDGNFSNLLSPLHTFTNSGIFSIKLFATSAQNCTDSLVKSVTIYPKPNPLFVSIDSTCYGTPIVFTNASTISSGSLSQTKFNFGDGSPTIVSNYSTHNFLSASNFSVYLVALSNFGCTDSFSKVIKIFPKPKAIFLAQNVCKGFSSDFINYSTLGTGNLTYAWNFGNGKFSILPKPFYIYPNAGSYTVSLIAQSEKLCSDTSFASIIVHEVSSISLTTNSSCLGSKTNFSANISPATSNYTASFQFGDGALSKKINPSHIYSAPGLYKANLVITTDSGCISSATVSVIVSEKPKADFTISNVCEGNLSKFTNKSYISSGQMNFVWNLGGIITSSFFSPNYTFPAAGEYSISLVAISDSLCTDTLISKHTVFETPKSDFLFSNACDSSPVSFTNTSSANIGIIDFYHWDFGDNTTSFTRNPANLYLHSGSYYVKLTSTTNNGCMHSVTKQIIVYDNPVANFSTQNSCLNSSSYFKNLTLLENGTYSSLWHLGDSFSSTINSPTFFYKAAGKKAIFLKVTSSEGCSDSIIRPHQVFELPSINVSRDTLIEKGTTIKLKIEGGEICNWYPTEGLDNPTSATPYATPSESIRYYVLATDHNGCVNLDSIDIVIKSALEVIPFNILTPDHNGLNDNWVVKNIEFYPENSVVIFDQWNQVVYTMDNYQNTWDGKSMNGDLLPDGTYYYMLTFKNSEKQYKGFLTLLRNRE